MKFFRYLWYLLQHKWYVAIECFKKKLIWRGLKHDISKLMPSEYAPYVNHSNTGDNAFDFACLLHQKRNDHHWQWWILPEDEGGVKVLQMSLPAVTEMLCDWRGASRAQGYGDNTKPWYEKNKDKMQLHPETRKWIEAHI